MIQKQENDKASPRPEKLILWQTPNLPIIIWFLATVLGKFIEHGRLHEILAVVAFGAIFTWAWLEIFQGVNYFRRALGLTILIFSIYSQVT